MTEVLHGRDRGQGKAAVVVRRALCGVWGARKQMADERIDKRVHRAACRARDPERVHRAAKAHTLLANRPSAKWCKPLCPRSHPQWAPPPPVAPGCLSLGLSSEPPSLQGLV